MSASALATDIRVNETQTQRQHPRFKLPIKARIGGRAYPVADWSVGGIGLLDIDFDVVVGDDYDVELIMPLRDCSVSVVMTGVPRYHDRFKRRAGFQFKDVTQRQLAMLQFVIDEYLAGRVTDVDGVLEFAMHDPVGKQRPVGGAGREETRGERAKAILSRSIGLGLASLIGLVACGFIASSLYNHLFVLDAISAQVSVPSMEVDAPVTGTVSSIATAQTVAVGDALFSMIPATGTAPAATGPDAALEGTTGTQVAANCACVIIDRPVASGNFVQAGNPVVLVAMQNAVPFVRARIPFAALSRIYDGAAITLTYLDGTVVRQASSAVKFPSLIGQTGNLIELDIPTGRAMTAALAGQPVAVSFDTFNLPFWN